MRRVYVEPQQLHLGTLELASEETHYLTRVLRMTTGERVELFDGQGHRAQAELIQVSKKGVRCQVLGLQHEALHKGPQLFSALPLIKGERLELAVRMLTELGVQRIQLIDCARSVVHWGADPESHLLRLQRVALAAVRQCGRPRLPELLPPIALHEMVQQCPTGPRFFGDLDPAPAQPFLAQSFAPWPRLTTSQTPESTDNPDWLSLCTGPEGGFTEDERQLLRANHFASLALGPHVLRAETAAVVAAGGIQQRLADQTSFFPAQNPNQRDGG